MRCKICDNESAPIFVAKVLQKYDVSYYRCGVCGFIQTEEPYWLAESYTSAIAKTDLGPINRAMRASNLIEGLILSSLDPNSKFLDYGGGYGILTRLMRDKGFDFYWLDQYCENLFAIDFVATPGDKFDLVTAFEVFEHLPDPTREIDNMLNYSDSLLFSTLLAPPNVRQDWWYFSPSHGQHVSFYTIGALEVIAERRGMRLFTDRGDTHLLTRKPISERIFQFFARERIRTGIARRLLRRRMRTQSLLMDDFWAGVGKAADHGPR